MLYPPHYSWRKKCCVIYWSLVSTERMQPEALHVISPTLQLKKEVLYYTGALLALNGCSLMDCMLYPPHYSWRKKCCFLMFWSLVSTEPMPLYALHGAQANYCPLAHTHMTHHVASFNFTLGMSHLFSPWVSTHTHTLDICLVVTTVSFFWPV